jgi:3-carboxy-cis,cis-muconate cycloisomerase
MMGLGPHLGRQRAHDLVYDICRVSATQGKPLVDLLAQDKEISKHVTRAELEKMCDPTNYLGLAGEMVDRVLKAEATANKA